MNQLELAQMEKVVGGDVIGCIGAYATVIGVLSAVALFSGPVGWIAIAGFASAGFGAGVTFGNECVSE